MYEHMTFAAILQQMLDRIPNDIDKREGSVIYDALAPAAVELAELYIELDVQNMLSFVDTSVGDYLSRKTAEFGVNRNAATAAIRRGLFYDANQALFDVPIGSRYLIGNLTYVASQRISLGTFEMTCETTGVAGNEQFGSLLPIDYVEGLARATINEVLVPGEDEETDEALRLRFYDAVNDPAFGGNKSDYRNKINSISGVGATKVYPVHNGGGTVKCTIIASDWLPPSATLVSEVQTIMDPVLNSGEGIGVAPIGHQVTIEGVTDRTIHVATTLTLAPGVTIGQVQADVEEAIGAYLLELCKDWANQQQLIVRIAQIDARLITVQGVEDVTSTTINSVASNLTLGEDQIPLIGKVTVNG